MQAALRKQFKKAQTPTKPQTGLFQSVMNLVLQSKTPAQIKLAFPNVMPQVISTYIEACKATISADKLDVTLARIKGIK